MEDDAVAQFTSITSSTAERARQYLTVSDFDLEQAIQLYFESGGVDMGGSVQAPTTGHVNDPITVDSDDEEMIGGRSVEDDEAMARRLQQEMYGTSGQGETGEADVRAPMARTTQTLVGPESEDWRSDPDELNAAVLEQMRRRRPAGRPGIFNQQGPGSIWDEQDPEARRQNLSRATGGASDASAKSNMLAELYRPPFEIMSKIVPWEGIRAEGKEQEKWIMINVQDANIFDCQVLNRDIWKNPEISNTIKEHFIFKQYNKDDQAAMSYIRFYFQSYESDDAYPHIAIVDPRTGEQVKVWSGTPSPKPMDFLMQIHEFLDRYSLNAESRNPVATRKVEKTKERDVDRMTEEEMLEMALKNSLEGGRGRGPRASDPDTLTRPDPTSTSTQSEAPADSEPAAPMEEVAEETPFSQISSGNAHEEPPADPATTTRIQFRHPGGRVVRRFELTDTVRRLYEWLKASPLDGKDGVPFELIFMGKNLIDVLDKNVADAGLKNGSVMVEFVES